MITDVPSIGDKYKLIQHPDTPIGTIVDVNFPVGTAKIAWDDPKYMGQSENYPLSYYSNGTLVFISQSKKKTTYKGGDPNCWHSEWISYTGLLDSYEYCKTCDMKRYTNS